MTNSCVFASSHARICGIRKLAAEQARLKPSGLFDLGALQQLVYHPCRIRDVEHLK